MSTSDPIRIPVRIEALSPLTEIRISDARFRDVTLPNNLAPVELSLSQGVYQISFRDGNGWQNELVLLEAGGEKQPFVYWQPRAPATRATARPAAEDDFEMQEPGALPQLPGESLVTIRRTVVERSREGTRTLDVSTPAFVLLPADGDLMVAPRPSHPDSSKHIFAVAPGTWRIRLDDSDDQRDRTEMSLTVCPHWHTFVDIVFESNDGVSRWNPSETLVQVRKPGWSDPSMRQYSRSALASLAARKTLRGEGLQNLLRTLFGDKADDPMLGIYGLHLLPCTASSELALADEVITNLARLVQGPSNLNPVAPFIHPDVEALRLRLLMARNQPLDAVQPFYLPPMLAASWRILLEASRKKSSLIPKGSMTEEISARLLAAEPWIAWRRLRRRIERVRTAPKSAQRTVFLGTDPVTRAIGNAGAALEGRPLGTAASVPVDGFAAQCRFINAALFHSSLREWFRKAAADGDAVADLDDDFDPDDASKVTSMERAIAAALHPIAADESRQPIFDASFIRTARSLAEPTTPDTLASRTGLPTTTVADAAESLAAKFLQQAQFNNIELRARSVMAVPDLIIPYDPGFLGDGFVVPLPALSDALRMQAFANAAVIDYTHFSLVMHSGRRVAIFAANNIDAARKVQVSGGLGWKMDERVGEYQLGPEVYADNQLDRGHMVRREDVVWGSVPEARHANKSTFFYANAAPQHKNFNQDEWVTLEDWVLDNATEFSYRLCVFTGPVLRDNDPTLDDLPPDLRAVFRARGTAQIPAAFWKVIVLRDASAGGEDLSVVAFAMRQSDMWNDRQGRRLLKLKVHQVTLRAIEEWTGLDFGELKEADELEWSEERRGLRDAGQLPEWPEIHSGQDIVFSGVSRRASNRRVVRAGGPRSLPSPARLQEKALDCGCGPGSESFDSRAAFDALSRDVVRLTETLSAQMRAIESGAGSTAPMSGVRALGDGPVGDSAGAALVDAAGDSDDARVKQLVDVAPTAIKEEMRKFARNISEQADIYRGKRRAAAPRELERIIGGEDVPPGAFRSCVCIGDATGWFCTGVVIAPRVVLTAAHCGRGITRIMVDGNSVQPPLSFGSRIIAVQTVEVHSGYRRVGNENDINLLILSEPAHVPPMLIASTAQMRAAEEVVLVGFGYNDPARPLGFGTKRQVRVPMAPIIKLDDTSDFSALESQLGFHSAYEFVAGRKGLGIDTCNGDSGGPAYLPSDNGFVLAGLTSRAARGANLPCGDGGIYVRPDKFITWISGILAAAGLPPLP